MGSSVVSRASGLHGPATDTGVKLETIVAAAVRLPVSERFTSKMWQGKRAYPDHLTITAPPPARHHTLLHPLYDWWAGKNPHGVDQGFITSTGRYVDREEGLQIALASGQPMIDHPSRHDRLLFSEDLW